MSATAVYPSPQTAGRCTADHRQRQNGRRQQPEQRRKPQHQGLYQRRPYPARKRRNAVQGLPQLHPRLLPHLPFQPGQGCRRCAHCPEFGLLPGLQRKTVLRFRLAGYRTLLHLHRRQRSPETSSPAGRQPDERRRNRGSQPGQKPVAGRPKRHAIPGTS